MSETVLHDHPLFRVIPPDPWAAFREHVQRFSLDPGGSPPAGPFGEDVVGVLAGEAAVLRGKRWDQALSEGDVAGLDHDALVLRGPFYLAPRSRVEAFRVPREKLAAQAATVPELARVYEALRLEEVDRFRRAHEELHRGMGDFFTPGQPDLIPGPFVGEDVDMVVYVVEADRDSLKIHLDQHELRPSILTGNRYLVAFIDNGRMYTEDPSARGREFAYRETALFLPCGLKPGVAGFFCPEIYPANYFAILLGREIFGLPKRFGNTFFGQRAVDLTLGGSRVMGASWEGEQPVSQEEYAAAFLAALLGDRWEHSVEAGVALIEESLLESLVQSQHVRVPVYVRQRVPQLVGTMHHNVDVAAVDFLVRVPFECPLGDMRDFRLLQGPSLHFPDRTFWLQGRCVAGFRVRMSLRLAVRQLVDFYHPQAFVAMVEQMLRKLPESVIQDLSGLSGRILGVTDLVNDMARRLPQAPDQALRFLERNLSRGDPEDQGG